MKHLTLSALTLLSSLALSACLPQGGGSGGGGVDVDAASDAASVDASGTLDAGAPDASPVDAGVPDASTPDAAGDANDADDADDAGSADDAGEPEDAGDPGKTCPDGTVIPVDQECFCPTSIDDCDDSSGGGSCATVQFAPGSPCGTCTITRINRCGPIDGCCAAGCAPEDDDDCTGCGNGRTEPGETCDGNCPVDLDDCPAPPDVCSTYSYSGSANACDAACTLNPTTTRCIDDDGCCPSGCDFDSDDDCAPPPGAAAHGSPCAGAEAACLGRSANSRCFDQTTLLNGSPLLAFSPGGICSPRDCTMPSMTCLDGTTCVDFMTPIPLGTPVPLCLRSCVDAGDCAFGMGCVTIDPFGIDTSTYCM